MRVCLTKKAEPPPTRGVNRDSGTASANGGWLRRLVRHQKAHNSDKTEHSQTKRLRTCPLRETGASFLKNRSNVRDLLKPKTLQPKLRHLVGDLLTPEIQVKTTIKSPALAWCLTKKAEPPPTCDVNRDSGTASANGGWLRRLVRRQSHGVDWMKLSRRLCKDL